MEHPFCVLRHVFYRGVSVSNIRLSTGGDVNILILCPLGFHRESCMYSCYIIGYLSKESV